MLDQIETTEELQDHDEVEYCHMRYDCCTNSGRMISVCGVFKPFNCTDEEFFDYNLPKHCSRCGKPTCPDCSVVPGPPCPVHP